MRRCASLLLISLLLGPILVAQDPENQPALQPKIIELRYLRFDGAKAYGLWVWREGQSGQLIRSKSRDGDGALLFEIPKVDDELRILPRSLDSKPVWEQGLRRWTPALGDRVWIREGDTQVHRKAVGASFVESAWADSGSALWLRARGNLSVAELELRRDDGQVVPLRALQGGDAKARGYRIQGSDVIFLYDTSRLGGGLDGEKGIYVVGAFNSWEKGEGKSRWKLVWSEVEKAWTLKLPLKSLPANADFKFKQKGGGWAPSGGNLQIRPASGQRLDLASDLEWGRRYELAIKGEDRGAPVVPRVWLHERLSGYEYRGQLGASCTKDRSIFRLFAPTASKVELRIYEQAKGGAARTESLKKVDEAVWELSIDGDLHGRYFAYRIDAPGADPLFEFIDPYAQCTTAHDGRGLILDLRRTDPEGFREQARPAFRGVSVDSTPASPEDASIYEIHVRDFTIDESSGGKNRGQYLGLVEAGTRGPGGVKTGLDHLLELGVTHVQILPLHDFENDESGKDYNWGYMPVHFNSPEGWYASRKDDASRVRELKTMIQGLHAAGLRAVLDVVYNHTSGAASFDRCAPYYYYRMRPFHDDPYWNGSGCGNEFRSESPMGRRFIVDSIAYWAEEYKFDGFRFDLMGLIDRETVRQVAARAHGIDPSLLVYGEPWAGGDTPISKTEKGSQQGQGFAVFNDHFRDGIKGGNGEGERGWVQEPREDRAGRLKNGLEGAVNRSAGGFALNPAEVINYVACHDNKTLWDKLSEDKSLSEKQRESAQRLATSLVLLAQGIPFLHGGQDIHRSKKGEHNSYNMPDSINAFDWRWKGRYRDTNRYVAGMLNLRKKHPVLRLNAASEILGKRLEYYPAPGGVILIALDGRGVVGETWERVLLIFNANRAASRVSLPSGDWQVVADDDEAGDGPVKSGESEARGEYACPPLSAAVLKLK